MWSYRHHRASTSVGAVVGGDGAWAGNDGLPSRKYAGCSDEATTEGSQPRPAVSARRNSFVKPEELDASDHDVKADDHVIMRRNRPVDLSISIKALYN